MAKQTDEHAPPKNVTAPEPAGDEEEKGVERNKDYAKQAKVQEQLADLYDTINKGWDDKKSQSDDIRRCWDVYNCVLGDQQAYSGSSTVFIPLVHDAVEARVTRFVNTLFPPTGRTVGVTSESGDTPQATLALLEHYVTKANVRQSVEAMIRGADISGQYNLYLSWKETTRHVTRKVQKASVEDEFGNPVEGSEVEDIEQDEELTTGRPDVMVLATEDLLILPATCDHIEDAETVVIRKRLTKGAIKAKIKSGEYDKEAGETLLGRFGSEQNPQDPNPDKQATEAAGVKSDGAAKVAVVYEAWSKLKIGGERRWCVAEFGGQDIYLACKRNPYWNDKVPVLSLPRAKVAGSVWGQSAVAGGVEKLQYTANDAWNMGMDSAQYALLPIVMTDPEKNPRVGSMVLAMSAIWETNPNDTKFASFPALWKDALSLVAINRDQIMQSLSVTPAMMPHGNAGKKPTQAQAAQEQQVALEATALPVTDIEEGILAPMLEWFMELDAQFRDDELMVETYGEMGIQARMEAIPPSQMGERYLFKWYGSEGFRSAQQVQQMIATMNVLRGIPPQQLNGRKLDVSAILEHITLTVFGPRMAPRILVDQRHQLQVPPMLENRMLLNGLPVPVHATDDDIQHLQIHDQIAAGSGDPSGHIREHMMAHMAQLKEKTAQAAGPQQGAPGIPGGAQGPANPQPGVAGAPRIGAQPGQPRPVQAPPGAVHQDQMPLAMPRARGIA